MQQSLLASMLSRPLSQAVGVSDTVSLCEYGCPNHEAWQGTQTETAHDCCRIADGVNPCAILFWTEADHHAAAGVTV